MRLGCEHALRAHVSALIRELDRVTARLQRARRPRTATAALARKLSAVRAGIDPALPEVTVARVRALHELAMVAEDEGWLDATEVLVIRKLAFRVGFYLRRRDDAG